MTVAASTPLIEYTENGVTLAFAVPWRFLAAAHLVVTRIAVDGTVTQLVQGTHWSATGGTTDAGGTLTLVASVNGAKLRIARATPLSQADDYIPTGKFPADTLEGGFDRAMMGLQDAAVARADVGNRALQVPVGETVNALPKAADRKGAVLGFNATTGQPEAGPKIADVLTLAQVTAAIGTVASNIGSVNTVAGIAANVVSVAGIGAAVATVAGIAANVTAVAGNAANVNTVASNIANVNLVAGVAPDLSSILAIQGQIVTVAGIAANVTTVAGIAANVTTVAGIAANVTAVAGNTGNVNTVAGNMAAVTTVAGGIGSVGAVAADLALGGTSLIAQALPAAASAAASAASASTAADRAEAAAAYRVSIAYATWAELNAVAGTPGQTAAVFNDAGTHTDPVVGGTVANNGVYSYSPSPAGWRRQVNLPSVLSDGDKGDITVASGGLSWTIDPQAVTYAKIQNVSAASRLLGRGAGGGAGSAQELSLGAPLALAGTTLGLSGTLAQFNAACTDAAFAPVASPSFTGTPTAPTQTAGNNSTRLATTAFVKTANDALIGGAPGPLDTLAKLATSLGNDADFTTTMATALAGKEPLLPSKTGNALKALRVNSGATAWELAEISSQWVQIASAAPSGVTQVDFTSIPQTYQDLYLHFRGVVYFGSLSVSVSADGSTWSTAQTLLSSYPTGGLEGGIFMPRYYADSGIALLGFGGISASPGFSSAIETGPTAKYSYAWRVTGGLKAIRISTGSNMTAGTLTLFGR